MARFYSRDDLQPRVAAGYGQGQGASYRPWLGITDVPSHGTTTRIAGRRTGRIHVFFSSIELGAFLASEWLDRVMDVREQFPLVDMDEVEAIADRAKLTFGYWAEQERQRTLWRSPHRDCAVVPEGDCNG